MRTQASATVGELAQDPQPPLQYFGGPVLRTNETYVIFWDPDGSLAQDYRDLVVRYFHDVAADSGKATNVYSVLGQYYDATGPIAYDSTFVGSMIDTDAYPAGGSGCSVNTAYPVCVTDGQLSAEVDAFVSAKGIQRTPNQGFFVFTPPGVDTCFGPGQCRSTTFCAYHNSVDTAAGNLLYALVGYPGPGCYSGSEPNGTLADDAINAASHEHREMIDDPLVGYPGQQFAWLGTDGNESSDKCVRYFGPARDNGTGLYNQVINGHQYLLQTDWSNAVAAATNGLGCVGNGADRPPTAATFTAKVTGGTASFTAGSSSDPDPGDTLTYFWLFGDGSFDSGQTGQHTYASSGTYRVVLAVQDSAGAEAETVRQVAIGGPPVGTGTPSVTITCSNSPCSASLIQNAIDNPSTAPGSTIAVGAGTYRGDITIDRDVTVKGDSGKAVLDGTNSATHPGTTVTVGWGTTAAVTGLTITGGYGVAGSPWGAGVRNLGVLTLRDSTVTGNTGPTGAGIYNGGHLDVVGSSITANTATRTGGGIANYAELTLSNATVSSNRAYSNGGGLDNDFGATATITGSLFSGNIAGVGDGGAGGAIDNYESSVTLTDTRIDHNTASVGGGIYSWRRTVPPSTVTLLSGVTVRHNTPNDCAGSITC